jgi:hypothetical protein
MQKNINMSEVEFVEDEDDQYGDEEETLEEKENFLGNIVLKTRSFVYNQLKRVCLLKHALILSYVKQTNYIVSSLFN